MDRKTRNSNKNSTTLSERPRRDLARKHALEGTKSSTAKRLRTNSTQKKIKFESEKEKSKNWPSGCIPKDWLSSLSLELLCMIIKYLSLIDVIRLDCMNHKLHRAVSLHLRLITFIDFCQDKIMEYMPSRVTDASLFAFLSRCPDVKQIMGLHPFSVAKRRQLNNQVLSVPGVISSLKQCTKLKAVETSDIFLLEAILTHLPQVTIMDVFSNRNSIFPIPLANKIELPADARISILHLDCVVIPTLPSFGHVRSLHLNRVRFSDPNPFRDFNALRAQEFVMVNCAGPTNPLKYVSLVSTLAASRQLFRLELVRVPFLGGLFQHVVEESWRYNGFQQVSKLVFGSNKNAQEIDLGYLIITCSNSLSELYIQPSLTRDSFFMSLVQADVDFLMVDTLKLGYIEQFTETVLHKMNANELEDHGLSEVKEFPATLTDKGMNLAGRAFPALKHLTITNCPHLHKPRQWLSEPQHSFQHLKELTLRRCHLIQPDGLQNFVALLPALNILTLDQMFRERPKGCSWVGLSVGTGLGVSTALVHNSDAYMNMPHIVDAVPNNPSDEEDNIGDIGQVAPNNNIAGLANQENDEEGQANQENEEEGQANQENEEEGQVNQENEEEGQVNQENEEEGQVNQENEEEGQVNQENEEEVVSKQEDSDVDQDMKGVKCDVKTTYQDHNEIIPDNQQGDLSRRSSNDKKVTEIKISANNSSDEKDNTISQMVSPSGIIKTDHDFSNSANNIVTKLPDSSQETSSNPYTVDNLPDLNQEISSKSNDAPILSETSDNSKTPTVEQNSESREDENKKSEFGLQRKGKSLTGPKKGITKKANQSCNAGQPPQSGSSRDLSYVNQFCQATSADIREAQDKRENQSLRQVDDKSLTKENPQGQISLRSSKVKNCQARSNTDPLISQVSQSVKNTVPLMPHVCNNCGSSHSRKPKIMQKNKATSTSDPVYEDDFPVHFHLKSKSLEQLIIREAGVTYIDVQECPKLRNLTIQDCRVLRKIECNKLGNITNISVQQCAKFKTNNFIRHICNSTVPFPIFDKQHQYQLINLQPKNNYSIQEALESLGSIDREFCLIHDYSPQPHTTLYNKNRAKDFMELLYSLNLKHFSELVTSDVAHGNKDWIYEFQGHLDDGSDYEMFSNLPWLKALMAEKDHLDLPGGNTFPSEVIEANADKRPGIYSHYAKGHLLLRECKEILQPHATHYKDTGIRIHTFPILFYISMKEQEIR